MTSMTSRERVLTALNLQEPDRVPWIESYVHPGLAEKLLGYRPSLPGTARFSPEVLNVLCIDNINYNFAPPRYARVEKQGDIEFVAEGYLKTWDDLEKLKNILPNPTDDNFYKQAKEFLDKYKGDRAAFAAVRFGPGNTYLSMGIEHFCMMIYDDPKFIHATMELFSSWTSQVIDRLNDMGFDAIIVNDDLAFKSGPFISREQFLEFFYPYMKKCADKINLPWVYHSCGNIMPLLDDLITLGMNGIANIEPGPMDIFKLKDDYGKKLCLVGNIDLHYTLTMGTVEETEKEVKEKIIRVGPGGGYIIASSNGLTVYCKPENVLAMNDAILKYGKYPININD